MSTPPRFSGPLERLASRAVRTIAASAQDPAAASATVDPDTLVRALNFALLGSGGRAFHWRSAQDCVVVSDTYSAEGNSRFTEVLHLNTLNGSCRLEIQQYHLKYADRIEDCIEAEAQGQDGASREPNRIGAR
jgi:hypothetical protein